MMLSPARDVPEPGPIGADARQPEAGRRPRSASGTGVSASPAPRIEFCRPGDEEELADFDRRTGSAPSTPEYWRWKYFDNPAGPACVAVARVADRIVGRLGFLPVRMRVHTREVVSTQQVDVAIMAEHRGGGVYFQLAHAVMEEGARRGIAFGFGFATEDTRALSVDLLGFDLVGPVHRLTKVLDYGHYAGAWLGPRAARMVRRVAVRARGRGPRRPVPLGASVAPFDHFDEGFDRLAADPGRVMTIRDATYLNWRYADCPTTRYGRYAARTEGAVFGFVVFHTFELDGVVRGIVDELVCSPDDPDTVKSLLDPAIADLAAEGAVNAVCWLPPWHPLGARLRALGFRDREARNYLIVLRNEAAGLECDQLLDAGHWYYTHGDSDYHLRSA